MNGVFLIWLQIASLVAVETAAIIAIGAQLQRRAESGSTRKALWQVCILSALALAVCELSGVGRGLAGWSRDRLAPPVRVVRENKGSVTLPATAPGVPAIIPRGESTTPSSPPATAIPSPDKPAVAVEPNSKLASEPAVPGRITPSAIPKAGNSAALSQPRATNVPAWVLGVWLLGAALVAGWLLVTRIVFGVFRLRASPVENAVLRDSVAKLARDLGIRRGIRMIESPRFAGPVAFGLLRPVIGLPAGFCERFNSVQREAMLAHELAHLAGYDAAWYLVADILVAVLWWHPLVWWARGQLHTATEVAADEASLIVANGPVVLAECLVELGGRLTRSQTAWRLGMAGNDFRSGLGRRVGHLVDLEGAAWRPPAPFRAGLAKGFGTLGLVAITIFSTAWVAPTALTKGENMQVIKQTWRKSLAAIVLLAATTTHSQPAQTPETVQPGTPAGAAATPGIPTPGGSPNLIIPAGSDPTPAENSAVLLQGYSVRGGTPAALIQSGVAPAAGSIPAATTPGASTPMGKIFQSSAPQLAALFERPGSSGGFPRNSSPARESVEAALDRIKFDEVRYSDMPLGEVIRRLVGTSTSLDPAKQGINIVIDRQSAANTPEMRLDPQTGLPEKWDSFDLESTLVTIDPPLRHVRLIDVLNAITKSADHPVTFSIEDYGVLVSVDWQRLILSQGQDHPAALEAGAFKLDCSVAISSLDVLGALTVAMPGPNDQNLRGRAVTEALRKLFDQMGVNVSDSKRLILLYNPAAGVLMVRAMPNDLKVISTVVTTLGGTPYMPSGDGGFPGGLPPGANAADPSQRTPGSASTPADPRAPGSGHSIIAR